MKSLLALAAGLLAALVSGRAGSPAIKLPVSLQNHTVRLTLGSLRLAPNYGGEAAPAGTQYYVFGAAWEDIIDPALAKERDLPAGAKDDNLSEGLTLVIDDSVVVPVTARATSTAGLDANDPDVVGRAGGSTDAAYIRPVVGLKNSAGKRSLVYYALDRPGDTAGGELLFAVPAAPWHRLELRYHDPTGGDCAALLAGSAATAAAGTVADPPGAVANEVFVLAAHVSEDPAAGATDPPPGRRYVAIDFQGRSVLKVRDQYPPYDPGHPTGTEFWRPDPAGWGDFADCLQLVADGQYPGVLDKSGDATDDANFVPGVWTHHRLLYLVPSSARSLDLVCFFNDYTIPGHDDQVTPKPVHFRLSGPAVAPPAPMAGEKHFVDGTVVDDILRHTTSGHFAGVAAGPDEKFLVIDVAVSNPGPEIAEFHAVEQLVWFNQGDEVPPDDLTARGPLAPPPYLKLAAGDVRVFQAVWRIPAKLGKADLGLKGNVVARKFTLTLDAR